MNRTNVYRVSIWSDLQCKLALNNFTSHNNRHAVCVCVVYCAVTAAATPDWFYYSHSSTLTQPMLIVQIHCVKLKLKLNVKPQTCFYICHTKQQTLGTVVAVFYLCACVRSSIIWCFNKYLESFAQSQKINRLDPFNYTIIFLFQMPRFQSGFLFTNWIHLNNTDKLKTPSMIHLRVHALFRLTRK